MSGLVYCCPSLLFRKNLSSESLYDGLRISPCVWQEAGFSACVCEERIPVPPVFSRHLRKQEATTVPARDNQSVFTDCDAGEIVDPLQPGKDRNLDPQLR